MVRRIFALLFLVSASFISNTPFAFGIENGEKALGVNVVGLFSGGGSQIICSGAVIEPRIIATAHHCVPKAGEIAKLASLVNFQVAPPGSDVNSPQTEKAKVLEIVTNDFAWKLGECENGFCDDLNDLAFLILDRDFLVPKNLRIATREDIERFRSIGVEVVTYGYGLIGYEQSSLGIPHKLNARLAEPDQGGYGQLSFNAVVSGNQNTCAGDSGGPTYVETDGYLYYLGPTSATRRPSCVQNPILDRGFFGGTPIAFKETLFTKAKKTALELRAKQDVEAKAAAELEARHDLEAVGTTEIAKTKKTTIRCFKAKSTKKMNALDRRCPSGYARKVSGL